MNIKKIESLLEQIEKSDVVVVDDSPYLHYANVLGMPSGNPEMPILEMTWVDEEQDFSVQFTEGNLDRANFKDNEIRLQNSDGEDSVINLYTLEKNPVVKNWEENS